MDIEKAKHYSLAEVVLLAIFALGLAIAWALTKTRSHTPMTEPIALDGSGLRVSVPAGVGWDHTAWAYESDNSMALLAQRRLTQRAEVELRWRYIMAIEPKTLRQVIEERLAGSAAQSKMLEMPEGTSMEAAQVTTPGPLQEPTYYIAWTSLPHGRAVELQVIPAGPDYDPLYMESLLRDTAMSMIYQMPEEMAAGVAMLERFWQDLKPAGESEEAFLIRDARGRSTGFFYAHQQAATDPNIVRRIEARHYELQQLRLESSLEVGRGGDSLHWQTRLMVPIATGVRQYEIRKQAEKLLVTSSLDQKKTLYSDNDLLPELLVAEFAAMVLPATQPSVLLEALAGTGQVVPVRFKRLVPQETIAGQDAAGAVRVEYLQARDFFDEFYFDGQGTVIGRLERQPNRPDRVWQKSDVQELKKIFGDNFSIQPLRTQPKNYF
ncbi:MAG: hypothetical protein LLF76_12395 [Planctomycetaceae bacterium]|nr:hypothetical protein [Planctomycetaceae bacterium]